MPLLLLAVLGIFSSTIAAGLWYGSALLFGFQVPTGTQIGHWCCAYSGVCAVLVCVSIVTAD